MSKPKILSITYDESLQRTRQMILVNAGYVAVSALGFVAAQSLCTDRSFDLIIIGHTLPTADKLALIKIIKEASGTAVLCLRNSGVPVPPGADYSTDRTDPEGLVEAVKAALSARNRR
jgi:DNA-binding response OmpR family regulator